MSNNYTANAIEVLTGLDPVRKRPGMYTDTSKPNHLAQEVLDNSVDEALAGYARHINVTLHADDSMEIADDGRGMPYDIHPKFGISGIELIMTHLHAGGKFSNKNYQFSGGLHGVGGCVVNALSQSVTVRVKRDGRIMQMLFKKGKKITELIQVGTCSKRTTGTYIHFLPDAAFFDSSKFSITRLMHILRSKAVLCPGLTVTFHNKKNKEKKQWCYKEGLQNYLQEHLLDTTCLLTAPIIGLFDGEHVAVEWAVQWILEGQNLLEESFVNLIPTTLGGTHVNGLRAGLLEAMREFCEFRDLLPRGLRLSADDIWENCAYVLSAKMTEPQFSGQTKERLSSRSCFTFVSGVAKDAFSLWLNQHTAEAETLAELCFDNARKRAKKAKKITRKRITQGPALPGKLADCTSQDFMQTELFLVEGDSAGGSAKQARDREYQAILPLKGKILNTWEVASEEILSSQEICDIATALGVDPGSDQLAGLRYNKICILADADSDGMHIATLLCALFMRHFQPLVTLGHIYIALPPLYRIDVGKDVFYALDDAEKTGILEKIKAEKKRGTVHIQRFKGLGEMNPLQLRETTLLRETRRLVQLTMEDVKNTQQRMDMLFYKKRAADRKVWLETSRNNEN